jgi:HK97 family phage portal protein
MSPDRVEVKRIEGRVVYEISNSRDGKTYLDPDSVFHLHGPGFDGLCGYSVITLAARAIGLGMAAEQFGAAFFENGTRASGVLEHPGELSPEAIENLRNSWNDQNRGPAQAAKPVILEEGMKWSQISIPPDDAQFLQTRQFQVDDIARWYGLPPHKLQSMEKATFSNIEHQSIEVVGDALQPWATRLEQEADRKLFNQRSAFYTNIDMTELLRGDVKSRGEYYREMWNLGVLSINEIRQREGLNPVTDGDKRFVQLNMTTLEKAGEEPEPAPAPPEEPEEEDEDVMNACSKIARRERHRLIDAATRYEGDRSGFIRWMTNFFEQH